MGNYSPINSNSAINTDLTLYQGQRIRLAFYHTANATGQNAGWYIDHVKMWKDPLSVTLISQNGRTQFTRITPAIEQAVNGDLIEVSPATYEENLNFSGKQIMLHSLEIGGAIIEGHGIDIIEFNNNEEAKSVLQGFTIVNGLNGIKCFGASPIIINCIIRNNIKSGIECYDSAQPLIKNCTIVNNESGIYASSSSPKILNSIFWNNDVDLGDCSATFSRVGDPNDIGLGNHKFDPGFINLTNHDYHLSQMSLCIDAGELWADYSNEPHPNGSRVNMGAFGNTSEAMTTKDSDGDGLPDAWEL
ncbi:right-handed parallel beta-helix repeat-containing protein, partial [Planctomycetota bacterium]